MKHLLISVVVTLASFGAVSAADFPTSHNPRSDIWIDYSDLDFVLSSAVLDMGPSTHQRAGPAKRDSMTNMYNGSTTASRFEGNRVAFHLFKKGQKAVVRAIRDDLLTLPEKLDLSELSRGHQLAYFLNLHNSIVLVKMAEEYPVTRLEGFFDRENAKSFIVSEKFRWGDQQITLADIQDHVLSNWRDPLVIYGFYLGAVGTPDIREEAFNGDNIYEQLQGNARSFVNSVRGTQIWGGSKLHVANYYQRMAVKFPNFETDVLRHIKQYARPQFASRLVAVNTIDARIDDWNIADLYNGKLHTAGGTYHRTVVDVDGAIVSQPDFPIHVQYTLKARENNFKRFDGRVEIEELDEGEVQSSEDQPDSKEQDGSSDPVIQ